MNNPGERRRCAVANIGGGARDRAGRCETSKQRGSDIGNPLPNEFLIGIVPVAGHSVGYHGGQ